MKRLLAIASILAATALLSGCYVAPGYSYVRSNGYQGGAYYGRGPAVIYNDSYYASPYYYGYGGYGYGCCVAPGITVGGVWYSRPRYGGDYHRDRDHGGWHGRPAQRGGYHGDGGHDRRSRGHSGHDDHRHH
ncbi:hypothetical protein [Dyella sp. A6]|uniref:hypothetical protein n=1 Tax=Dyella aluminiiresistens TaxID=3069105 RepID=UPI002E76C637|nr:hypothetical protein [Dyella sp. A6]